MFSRLGPLEIGLILLIVLMVFGVGKLPQVGAALGKAIRSFKEGAAGDLEEEENTKVIKRAGKRAARRSAKKITEVKTEAETEELKGSLDESPGKLNETEATDTKS